MSSAALRSVLLLFEVEVFIFDMNLQHWSHVFRNYTASAWISVRVSLTIDTFRNKGRMARHYNDILPQALIHRNGCGLDRCSGVPRK